MSGVLAAVTVGLIVGRGSPRISSPEGRLLGYAFWEVLVFLLNAVLFMLVGLQLPGILAEQERSAVELLCLATLVSAIVIAACLVWLNTVPYVIRALDAGRHSWPGARAGASGWLSRGAGCAARSRWPPRWRCRSGSPSAT